MSAVDLASQLSLAVARRHLAQAFRAAGIDNPELDARVLIGHALGLDHAQLAATERTLSEAERAVIARLAARRLAREPVARIVGVKEFWGLPLALSPATLVPRPESETVVEAALAAIGRAPGSSFRIADLGTGSGALLLALLHELPHAFGIGTDRLPGAVAVARGNARRLGLAARAGFVACDFGAALNGGFDLVVANPPYIRRGDIAALAPDVRDYDPAIALDGGDDGLDAYRVIAADARRLLAPTGVLVVELGAGQAAAVGDLLCVAGLCTAGGPHADLAGLPRALVARP
jgi:release factor glutamine methyltransferase